MSLAHAAALFFAICTPASAELCEEGTIWARSCAAAEASIRDALRPDQTLNIWGCELRIPTATTNRRP